jgi:D-alanyl-D-alanine carboxypeptidase
MNDLQAALNQLLAPLASQGAVSASVIVQAGVQPQTFGATSDEEPAFLAYSITKTFIAALVLGLCEEGRLRLEDPLARWFPRIARAEHITIRQLLNHTAGIPDYGSNAAYHESVRSLPSVPWSFERFAAETFGKGLAFEPGDGWLYSNPGYMLVKRIAEDVTGASFRDLVSARIAGPLGLRRTFVPESVEQLGTLAPAMSRALSPDRTPRDIRHCYHPGWVSHGVVASTSSEVVRFVDSLLRAELLSGPSLAQMMKLVDVPGVERDQHRGRPSYGLGLMGDPEAPWGLVVGHNGGGPGYGASVFHAVALDGASVCVMGAIEGFQAEDIVFAVFDHLAQGRKPRAVQQRAEAVGAEETP